MKLILGTASLGPKAYGDGVVTPPSREEIGNILDCAYEGGIRILEGSEYYHCDDVLKDVRFELIYKIDNPYSLNDVLLNTDRDYLMGLLYHQHTEETQAFLPQRDPRINYIGASVYSHKQITGQEDMLEVPLNIENNMFKGVTAPCKLARSVFGRGALLKKYSVKECLDYVKAIQNVHGIIVGVNSVKEMEEILKAWD